VQYSQKAQVIKVELSERSLGSLGSLELFQKAAQGIAPRDPRQVFALKSPQEQGAQPEMRIEFLPDKYLRDVAVVRQVLRPLCEGNTNNRRGAGQRNVAAKGKGRGKEQGDWDRVLASTDDDEPQV
jgi:hypothetical protein